MLLAFLVLAAGPKIDSKLVGTWLLNGEPFVTLKADGTASMEEDPLRWRVEGATLITIDEDGETERVPYQVEGDVLRLKMVDVTLALTRAGKNVKAPPAVVTAEPPSRAEAPVRGEAPARPSAAGNDQLSRLLLSSNWCWLRYSNGNSYTQKVHFNPNGTWQDFSESDISSNNVYAQTTAQAVGNRTSGGQWQVKAGQLYLSSPEEPQLQPVALTITRNSNGYPILNADGREYSMCN